MRSSPGIGRPTGFLARMRDFETTMMNRVVLSRSRFGCDLRNIYASLGDRRGRPNDSNSLCS